MVILLLRILSAKISRPFLIPDYHPWVDMGHEWDLNLCHFEKWLVIQQNLEHLDKSIETHAQEQNNA